MIIDDRRRIYLGTAFRDGLDAALQGVVRVVIESPRANVAQNFVTGWFITPELVVVPDFAIDAAEEQRFRCDWPGERLLAEVVPHQQATRDGSQPALLRVSRPVAQHVLGLADEPGAPGDPVFVVQHPDGLSEPHLSIGRIHSAVEGTVYHDANTQPGSGGAPILNQDWAVVGMHVSGNTVGKTLLNEGPELESLIESLRQSPAWDEIATFHRLADVTAVRRGLEKLLATTADAVADRALLAAAVQWEFDPATLSLEDAERLEPLIADPDAAHWVLPAPERTSALQSAGSLAELHAVRAQTPPATGLRQGVIDRILEGPPYPLDEIEERALPYWLQATRWFAGVAPSLPTPADIHRALERRRIRSRLAAIADDSFSGRESELADLKAWYTDAQRGPMVVTGIGGVGKSALVARFAQLLPERTLLLWLGFDRADLAPDDPVSVLRLLFEQLETQLDSFAPTPLDESSWEPAVASLGALITELAVPPLLVLDGFEVAQHAKDHREIWQLLERWLDAVPGTRVLVNGRAPVGGVTLRGRPAREIRLQGLTDDDARAWLERAGLGDQRVVERVLEVSRGVPLILRLAVRFLEDGGDVDDLPDELVEGFLYQRILDRVLDQRLKPIARDALVLRRLTADMIDDVLGDSVPADLDAAEVFARLARELALVEQPGQGQSMLLEGTDVLRLRPELRAATLRLLETDSAARVRTIDQRAAAWYAEHDPENVANAAELVYHRLRLRDLSGAEQAWRAGCDVWLRDAEAELPEGVGEERAWLRIQLSSVDPVAVQRSWEYDARDRIRSLLGRGLIPRVAAVLSEDTHRSQISPVLVYDAWMRWRAGDPGGALQQLDAGLDPRGPIGRDRGLLRARLAAELGDHERADLELHRLQQAKHWRDRPSAPLDVLTVSAARVRLTIDLSAELQLFEQLAVDRMDLSHLPPTDVVFAPLARRIDAVASDSLGPRLRLPRTAGDLEGFRADLDYLRRNASLGTALPIASTRAEVEAGFFRGPKFADRLTVLGWRRWRLVTETDFLIAASELLPDRAFDAQTQAILGTLGALAGGEGGGLLLWDQEHGELNAVFARLALSTIPYLTASANDRQIALVKALINATLPIPDDDLDSDPPSTSAAVLGYVADNPAVLGPLTYYILSPDPLDALVRGALGVPDSMELV